MLLVCFSKQTVMETIAILFKAMDFFVTVLEFFFRSVQTHSVVTSALRNADRLRTPRSTWQSGILFLLLSLCLVAL